MKGDFINFKGFLFLFGGIMGLDFSVPFFLPAKLSGPYLFWLLLSLGTIIFVSLLLRGESHDE